MHTKKITAFICFSILLAIPVSGWGMFVSNVPRTVIFERTNGGIQLSIGTSVHVENGDMTYTIHGSEDGGWKSELKWDLENIVYVGGTVSARFSNRFEINTGIWKAVTDDTGIMEDSDWLYGTYGDERAIYSESDESVDAIQFDVNLRYDFWQRPGVALGAVVGYAYSKWEWEASDVYQTSIVPQYDVGTIQGLGITYKEEMNVPYIGLAFSGLTLSPSFGFNVYALYSPVAHCEDRDDHIMRSKLSTGETDGTFFSVGGNVRWQLTTHLSVTSSLNYTLYDLEGEQDQAFYGTDTFGTGSSGIDLDIEGDQVYFGFTVGYDL